MAELVAGGYRATGRPFYNHMIGVASLTALDSRDINLISAALLHSIYELGRFPGWPFPPNLQRRRKLVVARVGVDVEGLVDGFHRADWRQYLAPQDLSAISDRERSLLLLKLADILEDLFEEMGPVSTGKVTLWPFHKLDTPLDHLCRLSSGIGAENLAALFMRAGQLGTSKIIRKSTSRTYYHTPLNSVLPHALKAQLKRLRRR
jgi:hypothetical protein